MCSYLKNCWVNTCEDITVVFLDESRHTFPIEKHAKASDLFKQVIKHLDLIEDDYFGLQYYLIGNKPEDMNWLDDKKRIKPQIKKLENLLYFRVKFYVFDTNKLEKEQTLHQFYLQVRRDIFEGRLNLSTEIACTLTSYLLQAELGDYEPSQNQLDLQCNLHAAPNQSKGVERKILELYKSHRHLSASKAEYNFVEHAMLLDTYGITLYKIKDTEIKNLEVGVKFDKIMIFQNKTKMHSFDAWPYPSSCVSFNPKNKSIEFTTKSSEPAKKSTFYLESSKAVQALSRDWVEQYKFLKSRSALGSGGCI